MTQKNKILPILVIMLLMFFTPILQMKVGAEENNENEDDVDENEIINRVDEDDSEQNIPNIPSPEEIFGDEEIVDIEVQTPASVTGEKMEGAGTVVDFTTTGERAFYTIIDNDNNTFYLIIDMDKSHNNVYFLSEINQAELTASAENNNNIIQQKDEDENENEVEETEDEAQETTTETQNSKEKKGSNNVGFLIGVLAIGITGVLAYHFTKKKRKTESDEGENEDEHFDEMDNYEDDFMSFDETEEKEQEQDTEEDK